LQHLICTKQNWFTQASHTVTEKKFQDFSRTVTTFFSGASESPPTFKYKDKQQLLSVHTECNPMHKVIFETTAISLQMIYAGAHCLSAYMRKSTTEPGYT